MSHNISYLTRYLVQLENTWLENILNILLDSRSARSKNKARSNYEYSMIFKSDLQFPCVFPGLA